MPLQPTWGWRALAIRFVSALAVISVATAGTVGYAYWFANNQLAKAPKITLHLPHVDSTQPANYLIVGSDSREFVHDATDAAHFGTQKNNDENLADVIMIAHVDPNAPGKGFLVSIPRDTWVPIAGHGSAKINAAFHYGAQTLITTIENNFKFNINHYLKLDFATFADVVNAIGRVHIFFPAAAYDKKTGLDITTPGCAALNGTQALAYARSREYHYKTSAGYQLEASADIGRIGRQQYFIRSLAQEAIKDGARNPLTARALVAKIVPHLEMEKGMGLSDVLSLVRAFRSVDPGAVQMVTVPTTTQEIDKQSAQIVIPEQADPIFSLLGSFDHSPKAPKIAPAQIRVQALNGSAVKGIAASATTALRAAGFASGGAATDADQSDYKYTLVRYTAADIDKARVVATYLGGVGLLTKVASTGTADVVVVLGHDFHAVVAPGAKAAQPATTTAATSTPTSASTTTTTPLPNPGTTPGVTLPASAPNPLVGCG